MSGREQASHRPGLLKQQNKSHKNGKHRSKSEIDKNNKGRVHVKIASRKRNKDSTREERRKKANQLRTKKREEVIQKKRAIGGHDTAPFLTAIIPLGVSANIEGLLKQFKNCDPDSKIITTSRDVLHISVPRFHQSYSLVVPKPGDLYAALDACKVADSVLFLVSPSSDNISIFSERTSDLEGALGLDSTGEVLLSAIMAQGLPSPIFVLNDIENVALKKRGDYKKQLQKQIDRIIPIEKLLVIEKEQDALRLLHLIGSQKQRSVFQRDLRSHLFFEEMSFQQLADDPTLGTLTVEGYVRYQPMNVNGLVHIPGWGDFQMDKIEIRKVKKEEKQPMSEHEYYFLEADANIQETLKTENDADPLNGEQTWPYQEEMETVENEKQEEEQMEKVKRILPKGTSEYQAAWIKTENDDESDGDDDEDSADYEDMMSQEESESGNDSEDEEAIEDMESVATEAVDGDQYDKKVSFADEEEELKQMKAAREDELFPDEVDTPIDSLAKVRFQKYRGLQSFRTSPWDPKENLPMDYSRIFQFENFRRTRKRVLNEERIGAEPGNYVKVHVKNVPSHLAASLPSNYPLSLIGILPHEQRMSVVNFVLKRNNSSADQTPIPSKERLVFHCGYRRYAASPIFSQHTAANKHKFERFFRPASVVIATVFAPIMFPSSSVLLFREHKDGAHVLVASGSVQSINPDRIVLKRIALSGPLFKVHKKSAVVRFMFFNREDIDWFKPVELRTKYGRRGHIKEPLGTHGHMKCIFDGTMKSQDTVMMDLYKRVFPKWTFDPNLAAPLPLYNHEVEMEDVTKQLMA